MLITADTHFYHRNIIDYSGRPFANEIEMNEVLISNWNKMVSTKEVVYHLGDFFITTDRIKIDHILGRLNGRIRLVKGNHDKWVKYLDRLKYKSKIEWVKDYYECNYVCDDGKIPIIMSHYPLLTWNKGHYGSYHLHGHSHGATERYSISKNERRLDVGVDKWEYAPATMAEIHEELRQRTSVLAKIV